MPTYVYKFVETGETIEVQQGFQDATLSEAIHPATGVSMPVKKVFTPVGVTFRGGGFYKTDSRGGSSKSSSTTSDGGGDKAASTSSTSTTSSSDSSGSSSSSSTPAATAPAKASAASD
jgi:predicted nucleic acid-binding Zn ribbon protein